MEDFADRKVKLESSEWIGIVRLSAESLLEGLLVVFLVIGPRRICRECSSDGFRDGGRCGNMGTLSMKTVSIGRIRNGDGGSVRRVVGIAALDHLWIDQDIDAIIGIWENLLRFWPIVIVKFATTIFWSVFSTNLRKLSSLVKKLDPTAASHSEANLFSTNFFN